MKNEKDLKTITENILYVLTEFHLELDKIDEKILYERLLSAYSLLVDKINLKDRG